MNPLWDTLMKLSKFRQLYSENAIPILPHL